MNPSDDQMKSIVKIGLLLNFREKMYKNVLVGMNGLILKIYPWPICCSYSMWPLSSHVCIYQSVWYPHWHNSRYSRGSTGGLNIEKSGSWADIESWWLASLNHYSNLKYCSSFDNLINIGIYYTKISFINYLLITSLCLSLKVVLEGCFKVSR